MTDNASVPDEQSLSDSATATARSASESVRGPLVKFLTLAWVPLTASFLSLILSVTGIFLSTQQPEVLLVMPDQIRMAQGRPWGSA